jgi:uridine phosphorylase
MAFPESELILNPDGSIYHLHLRPEQLAHTIITVGDPDRVGEVSKHFDKIEHKIQHREFVTHTGTLRGKPLSVVSTGIGTDNIDIVLTELDALVNIDFATRETKTELTRLDIFRIGTSGSLQADIPVDSLLVSTMAIGFDNLMHFYDAAPTGNELTLSDDMMDYLERNCSDLLFVPYVFEGHKELLQLFDNEAFMKGVTVTAPGFYAPQGRLLRGKVSEPKLLSSLSKFRTKHVFLSNMEMETAGIYGMSRLLGHRAVSLSAILANRVDNTFSQNPQKTVDKLIEATLNVIAS